ncbi:MAG: hypothetical protein H7A09_06990 [Oceanospirillaceae bacterium]|nr:hypothetical protein [Oceanospirillaceae bacterium]
MTQGAITHAVLSGDPGQYDPDAEDQVAQITDAFSRFRTPPGLLMQL